MAGGYEELATAASAVGFLVLRRRWHASLGVEPVYEITVDDNLLMSSRVDASERALAAVALAAVEREAFDVVVGGLGLGRTVEAVLDDPRVRRVVVLELVPEVVGWHREGLIPWGRDLLRDSRVEVRVCDFFATVAGGGVGPCGAILIDIDHAPDSWLAPGHASFYGAGALARVAASLEPGGVLGVWSAGEEQASFRAALAAVFAHVSTERVVAFNPALGEDQVDSIYVARQG